MKTKRTILIALLVIGTAFVAYILYTNKALKPAETRQTAPKFELIDARSGKKITGSELKGKVLFINFWATWCPPCRSEIPSIENLYRAFFSNDDFLMITIAYRDEPAAALDYLKSGGFTFPVYIDPDEKSAMNYGVTGVPETYIVDKKGKLRKKVIGPAEWDSPEEKALILSLLKE